MPMVGHTKTPRARLEGDHNIACLAKESTVTALLVPRGRKCNTTALGIHTCKDERTKTETVS